MKCVICKYGEIIKGFSTVILEKNGSTIIFKEVPSLICDNCGESYIEGKINKELLFLGQQIIKSGVEVDIRKYTKKIAA